MKLKMTANIWLNSLAGLASVGSLGLDSIGLAVPPAPPTVELLQLTGEGCRTRETFTCTVADVGPARDGHDFAFDMTFTDMDAGTLPPEQSEAFIDCQVALKVTPPAGYAFSINKVIAQGAFEAPREQTSAEIVSSYSYGTEFVDESGQVHRIPGVPDFQADTMNIAVQLNQRLDPRDLAGFRVVTASGVGQDRGNFTLELATRQSQVAPCNSPMFVMGDVSLAAASYDTTPADVSLQRTIAGGQAKLGWGWRLVRCEPEPECTDHIGEGWLGDWSSHYVAPSGESVEARLRLNNDGTSHYRTTTFTGRLSNIQQCGSTLHGTWSAPGGSHGEFEFTLGDDGQSFSGTYSFAGQVDSWVGRRNNP